MGRPLRILLQTTITTIEDHWHIGRFSLLRRHLENLCDDHGQQFCVVEARNRAILGFPDPVLANLQRHCFDQLWLFAVDNGDGLEDEDVEGIARFQQDGRGLLLARDHMDVGISAAAINRIGSANVFHSRNKDPDIWRRQDNNAGAPGIRWPNYYSGDNGDYQEIKVEGTTHPTLVDPATSSGLIRYLPSHPHEGAVCAPSEDRGARVTATGISRLTGDCFNVAVAFEPGSTGPAVTHSSFHHFADFNWDPKLGCPSFVSEKPSDRFAAAADARASTHQYMTNLAHWLSGRRIPGGQP